MNIGSLDTRCRVEGIVSSRDANYGSQVKTWALVGVYWCNVQDVLPSKSTEVTKDNSLRVNVKSTRLRMRYRTNIDASMRIIIERPDPVIYQIVGGPAELGKRDGIELLLHEMTS